MTHSSWNNERGAAGTPGDDNERLEYLGDAALELIVGEYLYKRFPSYDEGQLTQLRAALVNTGSLARLSERLELGDTLLLGRGATKTGARQLPSLLANAFEALIGAIFLDQGLRVAARVFVQSIGDLADWSDENFKGRLQEVYQDRMGLMPSYRVVAAPQIGGHRREYVATAMAGGEAIGEGRGATKQAAEQAAARAGLERLAAVGGAASRAAGAALAAAQGVSTESARVRRRVAEVAADRSATTEVRTPRRRSRRGAGRGAAAPPPEPRPELAPRPRGLIGRLRAVAEGLVGKPRPEPGEPVAPSPSRGRSRRGRRGGRGRGGRPAGGSGPGEPVR